MIRHLYPDMAAGDVLLCDVILSTWQLCSPVFVHFVEIQRDLPTDLTLHCLLFYVSPCSTNHFPTKLVFFDFPFQKLEELRSPRSAFCHGESERDVES
ncbi:hypothetical protein BHM03_00038232 [Ensete ventricosum]|nr:hypothetical protein BHM03_00038232 [Ensete ventricosum]